MPGLMRSPRINSTLTNATNDTGRTAYCGPFVLSALTGLPISRVHEEVNRLRNVTSDAPIKGTDATEVAAVAAAFGYEMTLGTSFWHLPKKERPTLWQWMQKPRNAWIHYLLAIQRGKEGHWILIKGVKICDTYTEGQWKFVCDGPHRGCKILEIYQIKRTTQD